MATFLLLGFIGVLVGYFYKLFVGDSGPKLEVCIAFAILGSVGGGLIFKLTGLGAEVVVGLLSAMLVVLSADVLSREPAHEEV